MAEGASSMAVNQGGRGIVVFLVWKSLPYSGRMAASFALILAGVVAQLATASFWVGGALMFAGNLLLLVRGYHNRVEYRGWDPSAEWEPVGPDRLDRLVEMDRKVRAWDQSLLDVTNPLGGTLFVLIAGMLAVFSAATEGLLRFVFLDALVLLGPHWVTGVRRILRMPKLMVKAEAMRGALAAARPALERCKVDLMMQFEGSRKKLPFDVKFRVMPKDAPEKFLGLYGQVVINEVQGTSYPYFYVVLVARRGFKLRHLFGRYDPPYDVTKEFKEQEGVEVLVVRQTTTRRSGYHTKPAKVDLLLAEGLRLMDQAVSLQSE